MWGWGLEGVPVLLVLLVVLHQGWAGTLQGAEGWDVNVALWDTISSSSHRK